MFREAAGLSRTEKSRNASDTCALVTPLAIAPQMTKRASKKKEKLIAVKKYSHAVRYDLHNVRNPKLNAFIHIYVYIGGQDFYYKDKAEGILNTPRFVRVTISYRPIDFF